MENRYLEKIAGTLSDTIRKGLNKATPEVRELFSKNYRYLTMEGKKDILGRVKEVRHYHSKADAIKDIGTASSPKSILNYKLTHPSFKTNISKGGTGI